MTPAKRIFSDIYHIAETNNVKLFVVEVVANFWRRLIQRRAVSIEENDDHPDRGRREPLT